jgi:hypothetical protein
VAYYRDSPRPNNKSRKEKSHKKKRKLPSIRLIINLIKSNVKTRKRETSALL